ncbi:hypothetical protein [Luteolibacter luteus]|uniref:Uncharacterized protein n=1 Tax=Luteolibacter luteus TaxID=2728835 RepID=A0A858RGR7_9BACT|nr:hypothetical protein [Luteolibacter luteus]QJE95982.1 hypothetical protein HHL09_09370 [Luteolibacter luteus]
MPKIITFGPKRTKALRVMEALPDWAPRWREAVGRLSSSSFATGGGAMGWKADIDFLLTPTGFEKTLAGAYDDRPKERPAIRTQPSGLSAENFSLTSPVSVHDIGLA